MNFDMKKDKKGAVGETQDFPRDRKQEENSI